MRCDTWLLEQEQASPPIPTAAGVRLFFSKLVGNRPPSVVPWERAGCGISRADAGPVRMEYQRWRKSCSRPTCSATSPAQKPRHHHTITPSQHHTDLLPPVELPPGFMV